MVNFTVEDVCFKISTAFWFDSPSSGIPSTYEKKANKEYEIESPITGITRDINTKTYVPL